MEPSPNTRYPEPGTQFLCRVTVMRLALPVESEGDYNQAYDQKCWMGGWGGWRSLAQHSHGPAEHLWCPGEECASQLIPHRLTEPCGVTPQPWPPPS
jgi:hypothetical protein